MAHLHERRHLKLRFGYLELIACGLLLLMCGCAKHEASTTPAPKSAQAEPVAAKVAQQPSPTFAEVNEAVTRVFKNAATIDSKHSPNFLAGDFNGDGSQDIAVILEPAKDKLADMNQEFPPWILRDLLSLPNRTAPPLHIEPNNLLLAIIHGYGPGGWREAQATQTYLLKNAVGFEVKAYSKVEFVSANQGKTLPSLVGDLISETLEGNLAIYISPARSIPGTTRRPTRASPKLASLIRE